MLQTIKKVNIIIFSAIFIAMTWGYYKGKILLRAIVDQFIKNCLNIKACAVKHVIDHFFRMSFASSSISVLLPSRFIVPDLAY